MGAFLPPNLNLVTTLGSHCMQRTTETLQQTWTTVQQAMQPLPPGYPPGPEGDMALELAQDPLRCLESLKSRYGCLVGFKLASRPIILVSSPAYSREVFVTQSSTFIKAGTAFFPGSSLAGNGLLVSDGEIWKRQRRLSNPAFRKAAIQTYAKAMVKITREMVEEDWGRGGVRDVYSDFNVLTMEIVASALFGASEGSEDMAKVGPAIAQAFQFFTQRATSMFIVPEWLPTFGNLQYNAAVTNLDKVVYQLISTRRYQLAGSTISESKDLLTRFLQYFECLVKRLGGCQVTDPQNRHGLLDISDQCIWHILTVLEEGIVEGFVLHLNGVESARDEDGSGVDDQSLRDELMTLLVAGQETSAILLSWALLMLALHPHTQELIFKEAHEVLGGREPTHSDIPKLRYLEAFIWETLRLMPPAYIVGRCACRPTQLGDSLVPEGTTVLVSPYLLHRDPAYWPRASQFDPLRWLPDGDAKEHMENDSFWPYGGGPRNCIGMGFAMLEVSLVLTIITSSFQVSLPPNLPIPSPKAMITLRPENQVKLKLTAR